MLCVDFTNLSKKNVGEKIEVGGFVNSIRDHGGLIFIDLRSQTDLLQCVIDPQKNESFFKIAETIRDEFVLRISGQISARSAETINPNLATGEIEVLIDTLEVVSEAKTLPFDIQADDSNLAGEETRLKYRYLDLRRDKLKKQLTLKHKMFLAIRNWFDAQDFVEVQTPILANSSPEGARDFLVPSRLHPGKFYALPQAPQQFKQMMMVGGFNKYFQIAPCFRDEDPRSDRHPGDFYQIDSEIAWATPEDIKLLCEKLVVDVFSKFSEKKLKSDKFICISHQDALDKYGSDKPDLRYELAWQDAKGVFKDSGFKVFADLCENTNARVQALVLKNQVNSFSRSDLDKIQDVGRNFGLPGIAYIQYFADEIKSPLTKFLGEEKTAELTKYFDLQTGDLVLFIANENKNIVHKAQDKMRQHIAKKLGLINHNELQFVWIDNFPFFEQDEKTGNVDFGHNPFSSWQNWEGKNAIETLNSALSENRALDLVANQYDIACNGFEVLSGGMRNSNPKAFIEAMKAVGYTDQEIDSKFKHMIEAYTYGAPNHAGFAWGVDRLFMVLLGEENIREVIAFPKNGSGMDLMTNSPSVVNPRLLTELGIKLD